MQIHVNTGGLAETNCYLLVDEVTGKAAMIDAPEATTKPLLDMALSHHWQVEMLLLTHGHWDHLSDHAVVTAAFPGARVLIGELEERRLKNPKSEMFELPYVSPPRAADGYLVDGQKLAVGGPEVQALLTPGHAAGHVCLYVPAGEGREAGVLFSGDLLMPGGVGRYDLPDSNLGQLKASLRRVLALPDETIVLSGHGGATTIAREKNGNPFVRQLLRQS